MFPDSAPVTGDQRLAAYEAFLQRLDAMEACPTRAQFFERLAQHVRACVPFDAVAVWLYDPRDRMLRQALIEAEGLSLALPEFPVDFGPGGRVLLSQEPAVLRLERGPASPLARVLFEAGFRVMAVVPISTPDVRCGILRIASRDVDRYSDEVMALLQRIGARAAQALERIAPDERIEPDELRTQGAGDRAQLLLRLTNAVTSQRHVPELLQTVSRLLRETIPHHYASVSLWDENTQELRRWTAVQPAGPVSLPEGYALSRNEPPWLAFSSGDVIVLHHSDLSEVDGDGTRALVAGGLRSGVCLPLKTPRGKYGVLNVGSPSETPFPIDEVMLLWQIARQIAVAIENAAYFDRAERYRIDANAQRDRFKLLLDVNNALVSEHDAHALWLSVLETVRYGLDYDYASLVTFDPDTRELRMEAATFYDERGVLEPHVAMSLDQSPAARAFQSNTPCVFSGAELDQFDVKGVPTMRSAGLRCICCIPLATRRGMLGTLNIASRREGAFAEPDVDLLRDIAGQVAIAVENTLAFREISDLKNRLAEEKLYLLGEITSQHDFKEIIGDSETLRNVLQQIQTVAPTDATVLLLGETGTGKELVARALHDLSRRREHPFIRLNGAAMPAGLIESELFGYERGAFTGAVRTKVGRLELAHRGTLFLDEVGDIPLDLQPKLLRALQEREFERLGGTQTQRVDVRLIAATNRNLEEMVAGTAFRSDLYYRLSVFPIHIPALRDRRGDIPALVRHFSQKFSRAMGRQITTIPKATMDALQQWDWPGNIRELQNIVERAVILSTGSVLQVPLAAIRPDRKPDKAAPAHDERRYHQGERAMILQALREAKGVIAGRHGAAALLGLKRTTLHSKMEKLGIKRPSF